MTAKRAANVTIVDADLSRGEHQQALVAMLDAFMREPLQGGEPLSERVKRELVPGGQDGAALQAVSAAARSKSAILAFMIS